MAQIITLDEIRAAQRRLAGVAVRTGLHRVRPERLRLAGLAELPFELYIKAESDELGRGVITYSSGNHAQGVAYAARALDARAVIVMPENAPAIKIEATKALGAEIVLVGPASSERRAKAEELARTHGYSIIPPYDDAAIIAGQGTCGLEILEQLGVIGPDVSKAPGAEGGGGVVVLSPVSGGGLLSGIAAAVKLAAPPQWAGRIEVWGAEPELAADAKESFDTKTLVEWPAEMTTRTRCDGLRTQSLGELNFAHILRFVDGIVTVSEDQILAAMRGLLATTGLVAEPSGAVTLAAALFHHAELPRCQRLVAVLSGGNIEPELRRELDAGAARAASA
jgi:threonine dehydratase